MFEPSNAQREAVISLMAEVWDDFVSDTDCFPDDFTILPRRRLQFVAGRWAGMVADALYGLNGPIATALAEAEARGKQQGLKWQPIDTAPKDGTPIWAYLYDSGIREVSWWSAEAIAEDMGGRPEEYQEGFYEGRPQDEWCPRWWLPLDALPSAPDRATAPAETQKPEESA